MTAKVAALEREFGLPIQQWVISPSLSSELDNTIAAYNAAVRGNPTLRDIRTLCFYILAAADYSWHEAVRWFNLFFGRK